MTATFIEPIKDYLKTPNDNSDTSGSFFKEFCQFPWS